MRRYTFEKKIKTTPGFTAFDPAYALTTLQLQKGFEAPNAGESHEEYITRCAEELIKRHAYVEADNSIAPGISVRERYEEYYTEAHPRVLNALIDTLK